MSKRVNVLSSCGAFLHVSNSLAQQDQHCDPPGDGGQTPHGDGCVLAVVVGY
jgi:hypothetical protein